MQGPLDTYVRLVYFKNYQRQLFSDSHSVDELNNPEGSTSGLMRYRSNFGASWTRRNYDFGVDGHYYYFRILPKVEWSAQGSDRIRDYWQFDAFAQASLSRWLPRIKHHNDLVVQLRVNNVLDKPCPRCLRRRRAGLWRLARPHLLEVPDRKILG